MPKRDIFLLREVLIARKNIASLKVPKENNKCVLFTPNEVKYHALRLALYVVM